MDIDQVIIYGFKLGNADPDFKEFILSLSSSDIHNLRKILYEKKLDSYRDGYGRAIYGLDRYGCVDIPNSIRSKKWTESENEIYPYLKALWVYTKLGHDGSTLNPIKAIQWKYWRALVVTSNDEAKEMIISTAIEVGIQYLFSIGFVKTGSNFVRNSADKSTKPIPFPRVNNGWGVGFKTRNYTVEALYEEAGGGTLFSIKQNVNGGNLFRLDLHKHIKKTSVPLFHYHYRINMFNKVYGSSAPRAIPFKEAITIGGSSIILSGDDNK